MAFTKETARTPVAIEDIEVRLFTTATGGQTADFSVQVRFDDGSLVVRTGDLLPHLTQAQSNQLQTFMATLRSKAVSELLP